eukprot:1325170-Rhodomonas_salina.3
MRSLAASSDMKQLKLRRTTPGRTSSSPWRSADSNSLASAYSIPSSCSAYGPAHEQPARTCTPKRSLSSVATKLWCRNRPACRMLNEMIASRFALRCPYNSIAACEPHPSSACASSARSRAMIASCPRQRNARLSTGLGAANASDIQGARYRAHSLFDPERQPTPDRAHNVRRPSLLALLQVLEVWDRGKAAANMGVHDGPVVVRGDEKDSSASGARRGRADAEHDPAVAAADMGHADQNAAARATQRSKALKQDTQLSVWPRRRKQTRELEKQDGARCVEERHDGFLEGEDAGGADAADELVRREEERVFVRQRRVRARHDRVHVQLAVSAAHRGRSKSELGWRIRGLTEAYGPADA